MIYWVSNGCLDAYLFTVAKTVERLNACSPSTWEGMATWEKLADCVDDYLWALYVAAEAYVQCRF